MGSRYGGTPWGLEDVFVNYGKGSGAEGRPDDQRQGRDVYRSVLQAAERVYERWQSASPLLKAQVQANLPDHMRHARYSRFEPCEKKSLLPETCALSTLCSKSLLHTNRVG